MICDCSDFKQHLLRGQCYGVVNFTLTDCCVWGPSQAYHRWGPNSKILKFFLHLLQVWAKLYILNRSVPISLVSMTSFCVELEHLVLLQWIYDSERRNVTVRQHLYYTVCCKTRATECTSLLWWLSLWWPQWQLCKNPPSSATFS